MPTLKAEAQQQLDLVLAKPYVLTKCTYNSEEPDGDWSEEEIARSATLKGIKAYCRLHKIPSNGEYRIEKETVEMVEGWYPLYNTEFIEEL